VNAATISSPITQQLVLEPPEVEVVIEIPRGSFLKRGSTGHIDFVSPLPCPFNYGSVPTHVGLEGDLLDAAVLGPRLPLGTRLRVRAWGAVTLTDRGMSDDKLICSAQPLQPSERQNVLRFFGFYARCADHRVSKKALIWIGLTVGSAVGGSLPALWGGGVISFSSGMLSAVGGLVGIWAGYRFGE